MRTEIEDSTEIVRESSSGWGVTQYLILALAVIAVLVVIALIVRGMRRKRAGTIVPGACPQCAADRSAGRRFCTRCGAPLSAPALQPTPEPAPKK